MYAILMLGRDLELMKVRKMLIEHRGYRVHLATEPYALHSINTHIDLLIHCHTLSWADGRLARTIGAMRWPGLQELALIAWYDDPECYSGAQRFHTCDGPDKLLNTIDQLLPASAVCAA
jgi:hypothetical protein